MPAVETTPDSERMLPANIAVLCPACATPVSLVLWLANRGTPARQVVCPSCGEDVVLRDAW